MNSPRYQRTAADTWCSIFVWDATRALGCEVPHWLEVAKTPPGILSPWHGPDPEPAWRETNANAVARWLAVMSARGEAGWRETGVRMGEAGCRESVAGAAILGVPIVAAWENPIPANPGHVAMVIAAGNAVGSINIVQAGAHNYFDVPISRGFGSISPRFFVHE